MIGVSDIVIPPRAPKQSHPPAPLFRILQHRCGPTEVSNQLTTLLRRLRFSIASASSWKLAESTAFACGGLILRTPRTFERQIGRTKGPMVYFATFRRSVPQELASLVRGLRLLNLNSVLEERTLWCALCGCALHEFQCEHRLACVQRNGTLSFGTYSQRSIKYASGHRSVLVIWPRLRLKYAIWFSMSEAIPNCKYRAP